MLGNNPSMKTFELVKMKLNLLETLAGEALFSLGRMQFAEDDNVDQWMRSDLPALELCRPWVAILHSVVDSLPGKRLSFSRQTKSAGIPQ